MGVPYQSLNHQISRILNKMRFDILAYLQSVENPYFSLISEVEILGSIWVKIIIIFYVQ